MLVSTLAVVGLLLAGTGCQADPEDRPKQGSRPVAPPDSPDPTTSDAAAEERPSDSGTDASLIRSYVDAARPGAEKAMEPMSAVYREFTIEAEGASTLVYLYTMRNQVPVADWQAEDDARATELARYADGILDGMAAYGIEDPHVRWTYLNADGAEIGSYEFPE